MTTEFQGVNLGHQDFVTYPTKVLGAAAAAVSVNATAWGSAVVEVQWSISNEKDFERDDWWQSFEHPVTLDASTPSRNNVAVAGARYIRLKVTTPDGAGDSSAEWQIYPFGYYDEDG